MKNFRKENKGFSLVELIVVVLIMAIIAVALAPQVMKWVRNSRESADANNYDSLYANVQLALTDKDAYNEVTTGSGSITLTTSATGTVCSITDASNAFVKALTALDNGWSKIEKKVSGGSDYVITVTRGNPPQITKTTAPNIESSDLK